jgi:hypothetical protein
VGELKRDLIKALRQAHNKRVPRSKGQQKFDTFFQKRFLPQPSLPINSSTCEGFQTEA